MNAFAPIADLLRSLPSPVRRTFYTLLTAVGAVLAALKGFGVTDLGPITLNQALAAYTYASSAIGLVAVSNVKRPDDEGASYVDYYEDDVDLSDFEPVGDGEDVYGQAAW